MSDAVLYSLLAGLLGLALGVLGTLLYNRNAKNSPPNKLKETEEVLVNIREAIVAQLLNNEPQLFDAIAKQRIVLHKQDRKPVAIFMAVNTFKGLLSNTLNTEDTAQIDSAADALLRLNMPVGHLGILPMYVSAELTDAPIFVAGGIIWTI